MRPKKETPAHETGEFAELVCTNSMRSNQLSNAVGLLKEEMRQLDSLIMKAADKTQVPAGGALAVDRDSFSKYVTDTLRDLDNVTVHEEEITEIPEDGITVIATGPLTSDALAEKFKNFLVQIVFISLMLQLQLWLRTQSIWTLFTRSLVMTVVKLLT